MGGADERVALRDDDGADLTYAELADRVAAARGGLRDSGVGPGGRVVVALGNRVDFVVAYLALLGLGAVTVPVNPESPEPERVATLTRTRAARAIDDPADLPFGQPLDPVDVD